jgi:hypothetical protein
MRAELSRPHRRLALRLPQLVSLAVPLLWGVDAAAFCRTTTCDTELKECPVDGAGCQILDDYDKNLFWPELCVTFAVQENGSPLRGISYSKAEEASRRAFQTWISADCGSGRHPSIGVVSLGSVVCDQVEYNHDAPAKDGEPAKVAGPNANLIVFRDDNWTHADSKTIALTTITFATSTGEILDADIEVNSQDIELTTGETIVRNDLQSVLTHEVGHFFGLAHSRVPGASMNPDYDRGNLDFRSLSEDDRQGICDIYGPLVDSGDSSGAGGAAAQDDAIDCTGASPRYGFSRYCGSSALADGCSLAPAPNPPVKLASVASAPAAPLRPQASALARERAQNLAQQQTRERRTSLGALLTLGLPALMLGFGVVRRRRRQRR